MQQNLIRQRDATVVSAFARGMRLAAALVLSTTVMASCKKDDVVNPPALASITVAPATATLAAGATQQFTATGKDANGGTMAVTPTWSVSTGGGTISPTGLLTAGTTAGPATVTATSGSITGTATVTITAGVATTVTVTPNPANVAAGGTQQFTATGKDANGNTVSITPVWSVAAGGGTISATGLFTAGTAIGAFANTVKATAGAASGTATVNVGAGALATLTLTPNPASIAAGLTRQFTVVGKDANGNVITTITPAVTYSVPAAAGTVNASGLFTAGTTPGSYNLTATSGTVTTTSAITITAGVGAVTDFTLTPATLSVAAGTTRQITATGTDAAGNSFPVTPVYTLSAGGGTISAAGLLTAGTTAGTYTLTAVSGGITKTLTVTVTAAAGALATVTVTPNPATIPATTTQQFTAVGRDAAGNTVAITPVWSVATAGGGTISATGLYTAGATTGTFDNAVTATSGTIAGSAKVVITAAPGPLATITVTPNPANVPSTTTQQFTAVGKDANANVVPIPTPVWSVAAGSGTISATGLYTAGTTLNTYTNGITVTSGTITGNATVTVGPAPGPLATVTITPNPANVAVNGTVQFTAVGKDANGTTINISPVWSVATGGPGTITATGLFTAGTAVGLYTNPIIATVGSVQGTASVNVTATSSRSRRQ